MSHLIGAINAIWLLHDGWLEKKSKELYFQEYCKIVSDSTLAVVTDRSVWNNYCWLMDQQYLSEGCQWIVKSG